jgi:hypothetical protein
MAKFIGVVLKISGSIQMPINLSIHFNKPPNDSFYK